MYFVLRSSLQSGNDSLRSDVVKHKGYDYDADNSKEHGNWIH